MARLLIRFLDGNDRFLEHPIYRGNCELIPTVVKPGTNRAGIQLAGHRDDTPTAEDEQLAAEYLNGHR